MKQKRILITYLNNGNIQSQVAKEMMFNRVLEDMIAEGREVKSTVLQPLSKSVVFEDGSKLYCYPVSVANKGMRATHIFVDKNILSKKNGKELVQEAIMPSLILDERANFDTSGKQFSFFTFDGELHLE